MTSRERIAKAINFQEADRVPIDLGGLKASDDCGGNLRPSVAPVGHPADAARGGHAGHDCRGGGAGAEAVRADVMRMDISMVPGLMARRSQWVPRRLFSGTDVLFMPGTRIHEEADGSWVLLDKNGAPGSFRMPKDGYYFDDVSFNRGEGD